MSEFFIASILTLAAIFGIRRWRRWKNWQGLFSDLQFPYPDSGDLSFTDAFGKISIGRGASLGQVRCIAQDDGYYVKKALSLLPYSTIRIPWSAIRRIEFGDKLAYRSHEGDYRGEAKLEMDVRPQVSVTIPWRTKFDKVVPAGVELKTFEIVDKAG